MVNDRLENEKQWWMKKFGKWRTWNDRMGKDRQLALIDNGKWQTMGIYWQWHVKRQLEIVDNGKWQYSTCVVNPDDEWYLSPLDKMELTLKFLVDDDFSMHSSFIYFALGWLSLFLEWLNLPDTV